MICLQLEAAIHAHRGIRPRNQHKYPQVSKYIFTVVSHSKQDDIAT